MNDVAFKTQTIVYFKKLVRIAVKEKFVKFLAFAAIIGFIASYVVGKNMFDTFEDTQSGFFTIASAAIWLGIFNSIQNICKEHEIIRAEYRSGMSMAAYVTAHAMWQFVICFIQSLIIFGISLIFINYNSSGLIISGTPAIECFLTILLLTFGADMMGLMISAIASTATTAMTIMPFVLIVQLIMSGVLFVLEGASKVISYITFSKWGMRAFGAIGNILKLRTKTQIKLAQKGIIMPGAADDKNFKEAYAHDIDNLLKAWGCIILITVVCYLITILSLKLRNHDS